MLSRDTLPPLWHNSGTRSTCLMSLAPYCLLRVLQDLRFCWGPTACDLSGNSRTCRVVLKPLPTACCCSGTCRPLVSSWYPLPGSSQGPEGPCSVVSGPTAPCLLLLKHLQATWCHLATHDFLPADAEEPLQPVVLSWDSLSTVCVLEPSGLVLLPWDPLSTSCHWSGSRRTYCIVLGPIATFLSLPRDPQDLCCCLGLHCSFSATAQGPAVSVVSPQDHVPHACRCSGNHRTFDVVKESTAPCLPLHRTHRTCAVVSGPPVCRTCSFLLGPAACRCSGTSRTCAVVSGLSACLCLGLRKTCAVVSGPPVACLGICRTCGVLSGPRAP